jgi:hypothetical protein
VAHEVKYSGEENVEVCSQRVEKYVWRVRKEEAGEIT